MGILKFLGYNQGVVPDGYKIDQHNAMVEDPAYDGDPVCQRCKSRTVQHEHMVKQNGGWVYEGPRLCGKCHKKGETR